MRVASIVIGALILALPALTPTSMGDVGPKPFDAFDRPDVYHIDRLGRLAVDVRYDGWVPGDARSWLNARGGAVAYTYASLPALGVWAPAELVDALGKRPEVLRVEAVPRVVAMEDESPSGSSSSPEENPGASAPGIQSCGAVIAVLDTGVDDEHESLRGSYVAGVDVSGTNVLALAPPLHERNPDDDNVAAAFRSLNPDPVTLAGRYGDDMETWGYQFDQWVDEAWADPLAVTREGWGPRDDIERWEEETMPGAAGLPGWTAAGLVFGNPSHGTHVAATAMGRGSPAGKYVGAAPCARLVDVKVLTAAAADLPWSRDHLGGSPFGVAAGLEWVMAYNSGRTSYGPPRGDRVDIINLSVSSMCDSARDTTLEELVDVVVDAGIVVVAAAGNCGGGGVKSPGAAAGAITVGAVDHHGTASRADDTPAGFSAYGGAGLKPEVAAPGVNIVSARGLLGSPLYHAPVVGPILADQILPTLAAD